MNSELAAIDWLGRGWLLLLAFTVAVLLVAALRKPCRRLFGTERAFQLWLLPPLAMLASQLPHGAATTPAMLPTVVYSITAATQALPVHAATLDALDWRALALLVWASGALACLFLAAYHSLAIAFVCAAPLRWLVCRCIGPCCVQTARMSGRPWSVHGAARSCFRLISNGVTTSSNKH
ncbi:MAG TPA: M56 family metallopeptidase [Rhodanobacter sp.]|jgi:hypothetical protein|nr:M56 family metallopeptidase [Rhodanobacter sp.]